MVHRHQLVALLAVLVTASAGFAQERARLSGKLLDEQGNPLSGVELALVPSGDEGVKYAATTNKKGRFTIAGLGAGLYTPVIETPGLLLQSVAVSARWPGGEPIAEFREDNVREVGIPSFQVLPASRVELDLVASKETETRETQAQAGGTLEAAEDPTGELKRLNALRELSKWDELLAESEVLLERKPDLGGAIYLRGVALWQTGRLPEAAETLRGAIEIIPEQKGIQGVLGSVLLEQAVRLREAGQEEPAVSTFAEAAEVLAKQLEQMPDSPVHLNNLVIALEGAGRTDEAMAALKRLIEVSPERGDASLRLAELLTDAERPEEAIEVLLGVADPGRGIAIAIYNAAVLLWNERKSEATVEAMDHALAIAPEEPPLQRLRGRALIAAGRIDEGVRQLKQFLSLAPDDPEAEVDRQLIEALEQSADP